MRFTLPLVLLTALGSVHANQCQLVSQVGGTALAGEHCTGDIDCCACDLTSGRAMICQLVRPDGSVTAPHDRRTYVSSHKCMPYGDVKHECPPPKFIDR
ncbi:hypothetical protein IAQ61_001971 [Plenodomus lingam]|uniref:Uncharacterized protein n=1 Tax=Leptosphaeria maculans (strain JN3 / isolate v23.1.3 / race Av1-4-5-6-7-8) TaxID=985895 RepID=E4ZGP8_LEPMJ|nr:predicted protein [Plenodomus lingam JN3]KAH9878698.1 hypothetical protein IAQ61_001971 [Plenodomus lingam]CBX90468.1 predicted protein [Plenodomus lingam JN3]